MESPCKAGFHYYLLFKLILKKINFVYFRTVEDAGPCINEVCANIVRSTVGRTSCSRRFLTNLVRVILSGENLTV